MILKVNLKKFRCEAGLSQFELFFKSNVPRYVISLAEHLDKLPSKKHQKMLADALDVPIHQLFYEERPTDMAAKKPKPKPKPKPKC